MTIKSVPFVSKRGNMLAHGVKRNSDEGAQEQIAGVSQTRMMQQDHVDPGFIDFYDQALINLKKD